MASTKSTLILLLSAILVTSCAYQNPIQPEAPAVSMTAPTSLTVGVDGSIVSAHVQNVKGMALRGVTVIFSSTVGLLSTVEAETGDTGVATTTVTGTGSNASTVTAAVGNLHASTIVLPTPATVPPAAGSPMVILNAATSGLTGSPIAFGVSSTATGIVWQWTFGDGATISTPAFSVTHVYSTAGTYTATVSSPSTASASATIIVTSAPAPQPTQTASLSATLFCTAGSTGTVTSCNASTNYGGTPLPSAKVSSVIWDWSDGSPSDSTSVPVRAHVYLNPGSFSVFAVVTAATADGQKTTSANTIVAITASAPAPDLAPSVFCTPATHGTATSCTITVSYRGALQPTASVTKVTWDWGDHTPMDTTTNPANTHTYVGIGTFPLFTTTTATTVDGVKTATVSQPIVIP